MKKLLLMFTLFFPIASHGEWTFIDKSINDVGFFIDTQNIKENNGYVYYWRLQNYERPIHGRMSVTEFFELDCKIPRKERRLTITSYPSPMAKGDYIISDSTRDKWVYNAPGTLGELMTLYVCDIFVTK
jgi:hypothetical protein